MPNPNLGSTVKTHRKAIGLSRQRLAEIADVRKITVHAIEKGDQSIRFEKLIKILGALNINLSLTSPIMSIVETKSKKSEDFTVANPN